MTDTHKKLAETIVTAHYECREMSNAPVIKGDECYCDGKDCLREQEAEAIAKALDDAFTRGRAQGAQKVVEYIERNTELNRFGVSDIGTPEERAFSQGRREGVEAGIEMARTVARSALTQDTERL